MWFHFVSHKLARLLLPFALLAIAVSSFWLAEPWRTTALGLQAALYLIALTDVVMPQGFWLKRVTSPVRTFFVLMAAALCAISIFRAGRSLMGRFRQAAQCRGRLNRLHPRQYEADYEMGGGRRIRCCSLNSVD